MSAPGSQHGIVGRLPNNLIKDGPAMEPELAILPFLGSQPGLRYMRSTHCQAALPFVLTGDIPALRPR